MKLAVEFPKIEVEKGIVLERVRSIPSEYIANPKAIAAQTFKSRSVAFAFRSSRVWELYSPLFQRQRVIDGSVAPVEAFTYNGSWIAYPYALAPDEPEASCIAWREIRGEQRIRHIRLCQSEEAAAASNRLILEAITSQFEII